MPPDSIVEKHDDILAATQAAIDRCHDPSFGAMTRIAVAPCSPFSVTAQLMRDSAPLARAAGVRLHTHLAETKDEEDFCRATSGAPRRSTPSIWALGPPVWLAHCVHMYAEAIAGSRSPAPSGALPDLKRPPGLRHRAAAGAAGGRRAVGLGVDGAASYDSGRMIDELHQALLAARFWDGPLALSACPALHVAHGRPRCLGRADELGSLAAGELATSRCGRSAAWAAPASRTRCARWSSAPRLWIVSGWAAFGGERW